VHGPCARARRVPRHRRGPAGAGCANSASAASAPPRAAPSSELECAVSLARHNPGSPAEAGVRRARAPGGWANCAYGTRSTATGMRAGPSSSPAAWRIAASSARMRGTSSPSPRAAAGPTAVAATRCRPWRASAAAYSGATSVIVTAWLTAGPPPGVGVGTRAASSCPAAFSQIARPGSGGAAPPAANQTVVQPSASSGARSAAPAVPAR
jgi:hypothetical protein